MGLAIAIVSQKARIAKSTLPRLIAREYAAYGWRVQIADGDLLQTGCVRRQAAALEPAVPIEPFRNADEIEGRKRRFDLVVMDGPPHSTAGTLHMAAAADLVVLPPA